MIWSVILEGSNLDTSETDCPFQVAIAKISYCGLSFYEDVTHHALGGSNGARKGLQHAPAELVIPKPVCMAHTFWA